MEYNELFARTELLVGSETMREIASKSVILFGVGGVGSWCAEGLIRSGITKLTIVDSDKVATANINRQLPATTQTVGMLKVEVLQNRLLEINPYAEITTIPEIYCPESSYSFNLDKYDYVVDAIDSLSNKADLLCRSSATKAVVFSSMGAGLRLDPQKIKVAEFYKVRGCKLASALRQRLKKGESLKKPILCVYSEEKNNNKGEDALVYADEKSSFRKARINGTMVNVTAVFGFTLSGLVIQDIVNSNSHKTLSK